MEKARVASTRVDTGCYVAGHHGQYAYEACAAVTDTLLGSSYAAEVKAARAAEDWDRLFDIVDEMEDRLNAATDPKYMWYWDEGELFLAPTQEVIDSRVCE